MIYRISHPTRKLKTTVRLPASKSLSNRALILHALSGRNGKLENISKAADTVLLQKLLETDSSVLDCEDAGTTFRFLTAYATLLDREITLTGSERMKQRPVGDLVNALNNLGAAIKFLDKPGYPPLLVHPKVPSGGAVNVDGSISSQFISALMMIAPSLKKGIELTMNGKIVSEPYIRMTAGVMQQTGMAVDYNDQVIRIKPQNRNPFSYTCEPDWSSASYWYEIAALSDKAGIMLEGLSTTSLQGDSVISSIMEKFNVSSRQEEDGILLKKVKGSLPESFEDNFTACPDLAQTVACTCAGLGVKADLKGLQSLRIKESNRAEALQRELYKLSVQTDFCDGSKLKIYNNRPAHSTGRTLQTHNDHRMAMSLAPLALKFPFLDMEHPEVVKKSYPGFWDDLKRAGFLIEEVKR